LEKVTVQAEVAMRFVSGFEVICVMCTVWDGVRCGRSGSDVVGRAWDLRVSSDSVVCDEC
jgi:hypothetical protein